VVPVAGFWHDKCFKEGYDTPKGVMEMWSLVFWLLFLIAYGGFSVWLAKALLNGIFLAVSRGERAQEPAPVVARRETGR